MSKISKKQKEQTQFSPKKTPVLILPIMYAITPIEGSYYRVIDS